MNRMLYHQELLLLFKYENIHVNIFDIPNPYRYLFINISGNLCSSTVDMKYYCSDTSEYKASKPILKFISTKKSEPF